MEGRFFNILLTMPNPNDTFEMERATLRKRVAILAGTSAEERSAPFQNQDVPQFLADLDTYEKRPGRKILIK
jgi:hypothetical protein